MKEGLKIALIQCDLFWENIVQNKMRIEECLESVQRAEIVFLPELFTTAFSVEATHLAEEMKGATVQWMKDIAERKNVVLCGSIMVSEGGNVYNRLLWVEPNGEVQYYDKRHLFGLAKEDKYFTSGTERLIIDYKNWKICPLICYDLRFPVFSRNNVDYDVAVYLANWPDKRIKAWNTLLHARAMENQAYIIGVNRVGVDGNNANYSGSSQVVSPEGELIVKAPDNKEGIIEVSLSKKHLIDCRTKHSFLKDRDPFELK